MVDALLGLPSVCLIGFEQHVLRADHVRAKEESHRLLMLNGGGTNGRAAMRALRCFLSSHKVSSVAFDFIGQGDTQGELEGSSLLSRTQQAAHVAQRMGLANGFSVFGSSMGAYNAIKLSELVKIDNLFFNVPAVYAASAYKVSFGPSFSEIIRQPGSWEATDAWDVMARFDGGVGIVSADLDEVIPRGLIDQLVASCSRSRLVERLTLAGSTHDYDADAFRTVHAVGSLILRVLGGANRASLRSLDLSSP